MNIQKHWMQILFLTLLGVTLTTFLLLQRGNKTYKRISSAGAPPQAVITPAPDEVNVMVSPDGTKTLTMRKQSSIKSTNYTFYSSSPGHPDNLILDKNLESSQSFSIPYNTWSPDNKYIFLKESAANGNSYYVYLAAPDTDSSFKSSNIAELFAAKVPEYEITEVTGWAAPTFIIVNAVSKNQENNVSFWYDVESQSFTQLSLFFN